MNLVWCSIHPQPSSVKCQSSANADLQYCKTVVVIVETTVHVQTVGAAGTTDEWPRIEATARLEENKPVFVNLHVLLRHVAFPVDTVRPSVRLL
jgi:hypothetical protein